MCRIDMCVLGCTPEDCEGVESSALNSITSLNYKLIMIISVMMVNTGGGVFTKQ